MAPAMLMEHLVPKFVKRMEDQKTRSAILNVTSMNADFPYGYQSTYTGSKGFLKNYSLSMTWEMKKFGIDITTIKPVFIFILLFILMYNFFFYFQGGVSTTMTDFGWGTMQGKLLLIYFFNILIFLKKIIIIRGLIYHSLESSLIRTFCCRF